MADETQRPQREYQGPYQKMWNLLYGDPDDRDEMLSEMSPDDRQKWIMKISAPGSGFTPGDQWRFKQALGALPQVSQTTLLPPAEPDQSMMGRVGQLFGSVVSGEMVGRVRQRLGEVAQESGQIAQQYQEAKGPSVSQGGQPIITGTGKDRRLTYSGIKDRPFGELVVNDLMSKLYDTTEVGAKLAAGFTDPKTLAAFVVSKLGAPGALAAATYFGYQGTQGLVDAIRSGKLTPESLQNGLLSMAGVAGSVGMAGEAGGRGIVPTKPAEIKAAVMEPLRSTARGLSEARMGLRQKVFAAAQQHPLDVQAQQEAVQTAEGIKESGRQLETHSLKAKANVEGVEHRAWAEGNQRFQQTRELVGAGEVGEPESPSAPLTDTVREAEAGLEGHPESITLFRQILKLEGDQATVAPGELRRATMEKHGIEGDYKDLAPDEKRHVDELAAQEMKGTPLTWDKLQRIKTVAEEAMRKRSTPPAIKNALSLVDDKVVEIMGQMTETNPQASAAWQGARDFWRQWREDFHTYSGPKGSASPLAGIRDAVDPSYITGEINRTQGVDIGNNRASATLRKPMYAKHGGGEAADSVDQVVRTHRGIQETPKPSPASLQPVQEPVIDAERVSRAAIEKKAAQWGTMNKRDIGIIASGAVGIIFTHILGTILGGKGGITGDVGTFLTRGGASTVGGAFAFYEGGTKAIGRLLERPEVQTWLLKRVPPEEITALRKIPGSDKVRVINTITDLGVEAAKRGIIRRATRGGKTINLSPDLQNFIGNANVQKILAAVPTQRSPGQQIRDLRDIQEKFSPNPNMPIGPGQ